MRGWLRLSLVFSIAGLLASRIGLLVHEFIGHGGMAYALGGKVPEWRLFLFGGGWIRYNRNPWYSTGQEIAIALAGCGSELIFAALVWLVSTRVEGVPRAMARIVAMLLCAHVCVYISTGTHYGYGDGTKLHELLSPLLRHVLVVGLSLVMAGLAYALAKQALLLAALLELGSGLRRIALATAAVMVATIVHGSLYYGERAIIDPDQTYEAMMQREVERRAATYAALLAKQERNAGQTWTVQQEVKAKEAYVEKHEPWPLRPLLVLLGALASALACWRFRRTESEKLIAWRMSVIRGPSIALALTFLAILIVDAFG
jgi:hypothetical protein